MQKKEKKGGFLTTALILILLAVVVYSGYRLLDSRGFFAQEEPDTIVSRTIVRDGVEYYPRQDIRVLLLLGIDQTGPVKSSSYYRNNGAADTVLLLIFDETNQQCNVLCLNRDTMLEMNVLGVQGNYAGTSYGQLALAHTYGTGMEDSCENTRDTLMNFLPGVTIDYYLAMNMDAIPILNDSVGGVEVMVTEDFSKADPTIPMGPVRLSGDQAVSYIRSRKDVGDQLNITRMERHKGYIQGFLLALRQMQEQDADFIIHTYDQVAPYIVTDCSVNTLNGMLQRYADFEINELVTPVGENVLGERDGEKCYEFYVDQEDLDAVILRLFYAPKG